MRSPRERLRIATTPAYMPGPWIGPLAAGIVTALVQMA
jgi:hypothetical protein